MARDLGELMGIVTGPRKLLFETKYGRVYAPPEPRVARVVDPKDMFK